MFYDFVTQGPVVPKFENGVAKYCGAKHGVAVNSATSALHIACLALGLGRGDVFGPLQIHSWQVRIVRGTVGQMLIS